MEIIRDWRHVPARARGATVALGNFDGVHAGHRHLVAAARQARPDAPLAALTFEPHPRELFRPEDPPFRLTLAAERAAALAALGVRTLFEVPFDPALAALTADAFVADVLLAGLGAAHLACGWDFAFGRRRGGDAAVLADHAAPRGVGVTVVPPFSDSHGPISSTRIRRLLQDGYPGRAAAELGRFWSIRGTVSHGDARGRTIGWPTANVPLGRHLEPARGVYAVRVRLPGTTDHPGTDHPGVANIGTRPTVNGTESRVEAHVFDWSGDLYGAEIAVELVSFLRPERRFDSLPALVQQIEADAAQARDILARATLAATPPDPAATPGHLLDADR